VRRDVLLIVNPRSANGATGRRWPRIERRLRAILAEFDVLFTERPGDAARLAAGAAAKYEIITAVGGDGTINEVVNGLVDGDGELLAGGSLGIIPRGTGSDLVRSLEIPHSLDAAAAVLARRQRREVDIGRARVCGLDGVPVTRHFINEAELGMGAAVSDAVNRSSKRLGGAASFLWGIAATMLRYRDQAVSFSCDGEPTENVLLNNAWIANGAYSGGGIASAPQARLDDGLLDLVRVGHAGLVGRVRALAGLRSGAFTRLPHVSYCKVRCVNAVAETSVPVEVDGELIGTLPATFDLLPVRLPVIS
jgi:diacylglycerol kinase (ATP)